MTALAKDLAGLRILVVEDEMLNAMFMEDLLIDLGCRVIGPAATVAQGLELLRSERPDAAVLDVNLGAERVFPVADALQAIGAPFVFVTGYGAAGLIERYSGHPTLDKPINPISFPDELALALERASHRAGGME